MAKIDLPPLLAEVPLDIVVGQKVGITDRNRYSVNSFGHAPACVGNQERLVEWNAEELAASVEDFAWATDKILINDAVVPVGSEDGERVEDVSVGRGPDLLRDSVGIAFAGAEEFIHPQADE
jgi:hypothetical protein